MNFPELTAGTAWIRALDPDAEFTVEQHALWIVFSADAESIRAICRTCIDLQSDGAWVTWDDASDEQKESATVFRYILIAE
jgi:hypothetical protein